MIRLFFLGLILLAAGIIIPLAGARCDLRVARTLGYLCSIASSAALAVAAGFVLVTGTTITFFLPHPVATHLFSFTLDRLSSFFLLLIAAVAGCVAIYAMEYCEHLHAGQQRNLLCACQNLFVLAMVLVVASATTIAFLFFWELMAAASFLLVMYEYRKEGTRKAGIFYFVMTQLSTLFVMLGIIILFSVTGSFAFSPAGGMASPAVMAAFLAFFFGFSIKAGIIPFHKWLPYAHPASPSPISALMSGVMLKVAVYALTRVLLDVFQPDLAAGLLILAVGSASAVLGIMYAIKEHDLKGMLAYSSIENIGIVFMGIGLFVVFASCSLPTLATLSLIAALFHSLNHAVFKSLLFLTAGSVVHATGTRDIEHMGGLIHRMPVTSALFFVGAAAIAALPPLNGFASEVLLFIAFFSSVTVLDPVLKVIMFICLSLFALTSALSAACFVKAFGSVFLALPRSEEGASAREVPFLMLLGPSILAAACVLLGLFSARLFILAGLDLPMPDLLLAGLLLAAMAALVYAALYFTASRTRRTSEAWGCGTFSQSAAAEYTGHGFSEPLEVIFSPIYRTQMVNERRYYDSKNCIFSEGCADIRLIRVFEEYLYLPSGRAFLWLAGTISRFQNGCLDTYLLYVFVAVIAVFVYLGWLA